MKFWTPSLSTILITAMVTGTSTAAPPGLSKDTIAEGWIALFDGETTFGWNVTGSARVKDGKLIIGDDGKAAQLTTTSHFGRSEIRIGRDDGQESRSRSTGGPVTLTAEAGKPLIVRQVILRPLQMESIFNGKNLSGWKVHPGERYKSTFEVSSKGTIEVKDGPGDLQTEGQWSDFILQLECRVNGKHLNSGVFFRCLPDQYQQGYEAQIRNQWEGDDRTKPVDFGTGAIYRRQPARKVVSSDGEWFTMTVLAKGNHLATWVDGYQVVDFSDTRPEAENARQGTKLGKGAISFQGHDPTTDLSFRNIRIATIEN